MVFFVKFVVPFILILVLSLNLVSAGLGGAALIDLGNKFGAPFAKTGLDRLHGNIFGNGRATRSTDVLIFNTSGHKFKYTYGDCKHGGYTRDLFPVPEIAAKGSTVFGMQSHVFATGVECRTRYESDGGTYFELKVKNPYIGSNSLGQSNSNNLRLISTKGQGDNQQVRWIVEDK